MASASRRAACSAATLPASDTAPTSPPSRSSGVPWSSSQFSTRRLETRSSGSSGLAMRPAAMAMSSEPATCATSLTSEAVPRAPLLRRRVAVRCTTASARHGAQASTVASPACAISANTCTAASLLVTASERSRRRATSAATAAGDANGNAQAWTRVSTTADSPPPAVAPAPSASPSPPPPSAPPPDAATFASSCAAANMHSLRTSALWCDRNGTRWRLTATSAASRRRSTTAAAWRGDMCAEEEGGAAKDAKWATAECSRRSAAPMRRLPPRPCLEVPPPSAASDASPSKPPAPGVAWARVHSDDVTDNSDEQYSAPRLEVDARRSPGHTRGTTTAVAGVDDTPTGAATGGACSVAAANMCVYACRASRSRLLIAPWVLPKPAVAVVASPASPASATPVSPTALAMAAHTASSASLPCPVSPTTSSTKDCTASCTAGVHQHTGAAASPPSGTSSVTANAVADRRPVASWSTGSNNPAPAFAGGLVRSRFACGDHNDTQPRQHEHVSCDTSTPGPSKTGTGPHTR